MKKEILVISLGGSIIIPEKIDVSFLKDFRKIMLDYIDKYQFIISTGGGYIAREYATAAGQIAKVEQEDKDWLGIHCTRLNAHLIRTIFQEHAYAKVIKDPTKKIKTTKPIVVAAGYKPGSSSDYDAVLLAKLFKTKKILNLTNIDYIYNKDPSKYTFAKPLKEVSWKQYRKIIPPDFKYGMHTPFDPVASKLAEKLKIEVAIINGQKLRQIKNYLDKEKFIGSVIK